MKITKYIIVILTALAAASCNDILNQMPQSEEAEGSFDTDAASVNNRVIGCYNAMHAVMYWEWSVTELRSDNSRMYATGSSAVTSKYVEQMDQGTIPTSHAFLTDYWDAIYVAIARCNKVLETSHFADAQPELKAQYEAEAKMLRAHLYFNLVRLWGPVFIVTKSTTAPEARYQERAAVEDVYSLIEGDLNQIIDNKMLPEKYADKDLGRVTMLAAKATLAKVYMTHYAVGSQNYIKAKELIGDVISRAGNPQKGSDLLAFDKIFDTGNEMNREIIFAIRYLSGGKGIGSPFGNLFAPSSSGANVITGDGNAYNYPSDNIINAFKANPGDRRTDISLAETFMDKTTGIEKTVPPCRYVKKFLSEVTTKYDGENDWPLIRLGDLILLYAEMENEMNGPTATAFKYLNMIRERAGISDYTTSQLPGKYEFREALRNERRLELAFENQRWFDLLRWGIAAERISQYLTVDEPFYQDYKQYTVLPIAQWQTMLPIPLKVININPDIAQNVGY